MCVACHRASLPSSSDAAFPGRDKLFICCISLIYRRRGTISFLFFGSSLVNTQQGLVASAANCCTNIFFIQLTSKACHKRGHYLKKAAADIWRCYRVHLLPVDCQLQRHSNELIRLHYLPSLPAPLAATCCEVEAP